MVTPACRRTSAAATSDSGMAVELISAVRQSNRKAARITITSTQPMISDQPRFSSDISMNVAGRKIVESIWTPCSPGFIASRAASTLRVTSSVLPVGCFSTISSSPGTSLMMASPIGGG